MRGLFIENHSPEKVPIPDRSATSKLPSSPQPSLTTLQRSIFPIYLHQRMPQHSEYNSIKILEEQDQYLPAPHRSNVHEATIKKHKYLFSDLEESQARHQPVSKFEIVNDEQSLKVQYYEREIENLKAIIENLRNDSSRKDKIRILEKENNVLRQSYDKIRTSYLQLQRRLDIVEADRSMSVKLFQNESELLQTRLQLQEVIQQNERLKEELAEASGQHLEKEEKTVKQSKETQHYLQAQIKQLNERLIEINQKGHNRTRQSSQYSKVTVDSQRITEELAQLRREHHNSQVISKQQTQRLQNELLKTQEILLQCRSIIEYKNKELEYVLEQFNNLKQLMVQMNFDAIESDYKTLEKTLKAKEQHRSVDIQKLEIIILELTDENKRLRHEHITLKTDISTLKTDSQLLDSHVGLLRTEKQSLLVEIQSLKQTIESYLKSEYSTKSHQIEAKLVPQSFSAQLDHKCYELEHMREALKSFTIRLDKLCQQLRNDLLSLNTIH